MNKTATYLQSILELTNLRVYREINRTGQTSRSAKQRDVAQHGIVHHGHTAQLTTCSTASGGGLGLLMPLPSGTCGSRCSWRKHKHGQHAGGMRQGAAAHWAHVPDGLGFAGIVELHLQGLFQPHN